MSGRAAPAMCVVCGGAPGVGPRLPTGAASRRCIRCGLVWWDWPEFEPAALYDRDYFQSTQHAKGYDDYAALEPGVRRTARLRLGRLERCVRLGSESGAGAKRRLFEIGCGTGVFLDEARSAGWEVCGAEVSAYGAAQAAQRGLRVERAAIEELRPTSEKFDCVAMWDVIEHLRDPDGAIAFAASILRPGGWMALSTGDVDSMAARVSGSRWHLYNLPEHLFFFTVRSLRALLARHGFETKLVVREWQWVPASYLVERLSKTLLRRQTRPGAGPRWLLPATLFDIVGLYGQLREAGAAREPGR